MYNLEFNVGTGSIHQLPQTTGDGIHTSECGWMATSSCVRN